MIKYVYLIFILAIFACSSNDNEQRVTPGNTEKVVKNLRESLRQHPDSAVLRMRLINSLDSLHQYNIALNHVDSLLQKDSLNQGLWVTKAHLLENNKDTFNAIISYEKAMKIYPSLEAQLYLANLYAEIKNPRSLALCKNVLQMAQGRETDANCYFIMGVYYSRNGNSSKAIEILDKSIAENYTLIEAYLEKGFIYYDKKDFSGALGVFETAQKVNSRNPDVYYWIARAYEQLGNKQEALINYQNALGLDENLTEAKEAITRLNQG